MEVIGVGLLCLAAATFAGGVTLEINEGGTTPRSSRHASQEMRRLGLDLAMLGLIALCLGFFLP